MNNSPKKMRKVIIVKKDEDVPGDVTLARTSMEGKLRDIGNTKDKMLKSDPNLEKNVVIHQDRKDDDPIL